MPVNIEGMRGKRFVLAEEVAMLQAPPEPPALGPLYRLFRARP